MPNGGGDCCGTCWFNETNHGEPGHGYPGSGHCVIRDLAIRSPYWTYCSNHPHHNPGRIEVPIGPVFVVDSGDRGSYPRRILEPALDNPQVREALLDIVAGIEDQPARRYPAGFRIDEMAILELARMRERAALPHLERIAQFGELGMSKLVELATEAIQAIEAETGTDDS